MRSFAIAKRRVGDTPPTQPGDQALAGLPSGGQILAKNRTLAADTRRTSNHSA